MFIPVSHHFSARAGHPKRHQIPLPMRRGSASWPWNDPTQLTRNWYRWNLWFMYIYLMIDSFCELLFLGGWGSIDRNLLLPVLILFKMFKNVEIFSKWRPGSEDSMAFSPSNVLPVMVFWCVSFLQPMVNCWFGWWLGILGVHPSIPIPFIFRDSRNPNH